LASSIPGKDGKVTLNSAGMRELLKSPGIRSMLMARMQRVQSALPGSQMTVTTTPTRTRVKVARGSDFDEANTGDLSRALSLSGGLRGTQVKGMAKPSRRAQT
jgi:hypothetical protein